MGPALLLAQGGLQLLPVGLGGGQAVIAVTDGQYHRLLPFGSGPAAGKGGRVGQRRQRVYRQHPRHIGAQNKAALVQAHGIQRQKQRRIGQLADVKTVIMHDKSPLLKSLHGEYKKASVSLPEIPIP